MPPPPGGHRTWTRDGFLISTDPSLVPLDSLNDAFASSYLYWAKPLPEADLRRMLENSLVFGLYSPTGALPPTPPQPQTTDEATPADVVHEIATHVAPPAANTTAPTPAADPSADPSLIGFARCITDTVTFAYLTDVYVLPAWRGQSLGRWLVACVQETVSDSSMPQLRRCMAVLGGRGEMSGLYRELMGLEPLEQGEKAGGWVVHRRGLGSVRT